MAANGEGQVTGMGEAPGVPISNAAQEPWSVEAALAQITGGVPETDSTSPITFFHMMERLKTTKREGWRRFGIMQGESISDHMYRMSLITMLAPSSLASRINVQHCTKMALIHDMAEALVGDITPADGMEKPEKNRRESATMDYFVNRLLGQVNGGLTGKEIKAVWQEYEDDKTLESHFVHDVDKIELMLQMVEYEKAHNFEKDLAEFSWVAQNIRLDEMKKWAKDILDERETVWAGRPHNTYTEDSPPDPVALAQSKEYYGHRTPAPAADGRS